MTTEEWIDKVEQLVDEFHDLANTSDLIEQLLADGTINREMDTTVAAGLVYKNIY